MDGALETEISYVDSFGNVRLAARADALAAAFGGSGGIGTLRARIGQMSLDDVTFAPSFGHVARGATLLYVDSTGDLALADNQANLAERIAAKRGIGVRLERGD